MPWNTWDLVTIERDTEFCVNKMETVKTQIGSQKPWLPALRHSPSGLLQRKCACGNHTIAGGDCTACSKESKSSLRRSAISRESVNGHDNGVPPIVHEVLRSPGQPLDDATRAFFEPRFGYDFSSVRVHTDGRAAESVAAVNALAYTIGRNVVFGAGYASGSSDGRRLMAHELTHVVQQAAAEVSSASQLTAPDHSSEREADHVADLVIAGTRPIASGIVSAPPSVQRSCSNGRWVREYDGCSVPWYVLALIGTVDKDNPARGADTHFVNTARTGPCDRHDECYQTCNRSPGARAACDLRMYQAMMAVCRSSSAPSEIKGRCFHYAGVYYMGLQQFGNSAFTERQGQVCNCAVTSGRPTTAPTYLVTPTSGQR